MRDNSDLSIKDALITISYRDRAGRVVKRFSTCWDLAHFFQTHHPEIAEAFGYASKTNKGERRSDPLWECLKRFEATGFVNSLSDCYRGRIMCQEAGLIGQHAEGFYITQQGKDMIEKIKGMQSEKRAL